MKIKDKNGYEIIFNHNKETRDLVFKKCLEYFIEHDNFIGEGIMQCDETIIDAPEVMADLADNIFQFVYLREEEQE